jgi:hypothetical protein
MRNYSPAIMDSFMEMIEPAGRGLIVDRRLINVIKTCNGEERLLWGSFLYDVKPLKWAFTSAPLEDVNDEGAIRIQNPQTKRQLAIQKDGLVIISQTEFDLLDNVSKAALKLHEDTICAIKAMNPSVIDLQGTAPIRYFVREFVSFAVGNGTTEPTPASAVNDAAQALMPAPVSTEDVGIRSANCSLSLYSSPSAKPNVIVVCSEFADKGTSVRLKIELAPGQAILNTWYLAPPSFLYDLRVKEAKSLVQNNLSILKGKWSAYVGK